MTLPGLHFFPHAFLPTLPVIAVLMALGCASLGRQLARQRSATQAASFAFMAAAVVIAVSIFSNRTCLFELPPALVARVIYNDNPFPEAVDVAKQISALARPGDTVLVLGSEPEIFFYTGLRSATPHIYMYPLTEDQPYAARMQSELIADAERAKPEFVVVVNAQTSWVTVSTLRDQQIFAWADDYLEQHYRLWVIADTVSPTHTEWAAGSEAAASYQPQTDRWIKIFRRK